LHPYDLASLAGVGGLLLSIELDSLTSAAYC
jgi:hypothetical protein